MGAFARNVAQNNELAVKKERGCKNSPLFYKLEFIIKILTTGE